MVAVLLPATDVQVEACSLSRESPPDFDQTLPARHPVFRLAMAGLFSMAPRSSILCFQNGPEHPRHLFVLLHQAGEKIGGASVAELLAGRNYIRTQLSDH